MSVYQRKKFLICQFHISTSAYSLILNIFIMFKIEVMYLYLQNRCSTCFNHIGVSACSNNISKYSTCFNHISISACNNNISKYSTCFNHIGVSACNNNISKYLTCSILVFLLIKYALCLYVG